MIKKTFIGVCGLVIVAVFSVSAFADQSIGYRQYFDEGVKAFKEHDDQKAFRCFKLAQIYDPADKDLNRYLDILQKRGVVLELPQSQLPPEKSIGYRYYFSGGVKAFQDHNDEKAIRYFKIAIIFNPASKEAVRYLRILSQPRPYSPPEQLQPAETVTQIPEVPVAQINAQPQPEEEATPQAAPSVPVPQVSEQAVAQPQPEEEATPQAAPSVPAPQVPEQAVAQPQPYSQPPVQPQPEEVMPQAAPSVPAPQVPEQAVAQPQPYSPPPVQPQPKEVMPQAAAQPQPTAVVPQPNVYIPVLRPKQAPTVIPLAQIINSSAKPTLIIELNSSVILETNNIQQFLLVQEGVIGVRKIDTDHLEIDALSIGTTFLHIWDDSGRHTLYVEVIFPKSVSSSNSPQVLNGVQHSQPFKFTYTNDWDTYYSGKNIPDLKRQSYEFNETLGVTGETPYGFFDSSGSYSDFDSISEFDTYTIGLSQIPVEGTSNFNLRGFDAFRYLSPLTMPGTRLRGVFADVDLMEDTIGLSVSHGQEQVPLGFLSSGASQFNDSYIDAVKLTLFPKSNSDRYSINFATAYGSDRPSYLSDHVYSIEGQHKFNDFLTFNAEQGSDSEHQSTLASFNWLEGTFKSDLSFRNIDKNYSTISSLPAYQGETGAAWTTDGEFKNYTEDTFVEAYRDRLDPNPDDPSAYNFDGNGHFRANITPDSWSDTDFNFMDNQGEPSPEKNFGLNERLSRNFGIWNSLKGTVFTGAGYQDSHSSGSDISDYDRENVIAGIQLPLTNHLTSFTNYEYDWLDQPDSGGKSNPSVIDAGFEYQKPFSSKLSFNAQVSWHDELGVKPSSDSFLSGEESVIITSGLNYNPTPDVNIFADGNASKVLFHSGNPSYDDYEIHVGMRITFGGATYWDPLGTVSGIVFKDRNGDGKFAPGDEGIPGVKLKVGDKEAVTDKNGRYYVQIRAKGVDVYPVLDSIPGGLLFSTPQTLSVRVFQGRTSHADFGLMSQTGIYGIVFVSKNGSNVPNEGDHFIGKVRVILDGKIKQKSDLHGAFYFRHVSPGQHIISIDLNSLELNMVPLVKLENKIDVAEGTNYAFNIPIKIEKADNEEK